jgi:hypothetical protein
MPESLENIAVDKWKMGLFALVLVCVTVLVSLNKLPSEVPSPIGAKESKQ